LAWIRAILARPYSPLGEKSRAVEKLTREKSTEKTLRKDALETTFSAPLDILGHDPRLLEIQWNGANRLVIRYTSDSSSPKEFRCQSQGAMFKSSAFHMRPTTANPLRICRLSRDHGKEREWLGSLA
jgi:hypothetical protein